VDVAVIGGGPAGSTAARLLADWGHSVAIITRPPPRPALAESLPPSSLRLLEYLGWRPLVDAAGFIRSTGNTYIWDSREADTGLAMRQATFGGMERGYQLDRAVFNDLLLAEAVRHGARLIDHATVVSVNAGVVAYRQSDGDHTVWARWVLDCSGRAGVVARLGWRRPLPRLRTLAIAAVWEHADGWPHIDPTHTVVESHRDGWAWSIPTSPTQRHVTMMLDPRLTSIATRQALREAYLGALDATPGMRGLTEGARLTGDPFARDASPYAAHQVAAPNLLLVGDAASFVDPLSSYGVKKALASAWLAAVVAHTCLEDARMLRHALAFYDARERAMFESLERQRAQLAHAALAGDARSAFWEERAEADALALASPNEDREIESLRGDREVLAAFEELKRRERIVLRHAATVERVEQPLVRGNRIVLETHLRSPQLPFAVRFARQVDLLRLWHLAPSAAEVPELYEAYQRVAGVVPLPDFLGALSLLIGKGFLVFA
jgi:flavin-dependent dehydrogenase